MLLPCGINYSRTRIQRDSGFYNVVEVVVDDPSRLDFLRRINEDRDSKLANIGQLRLLKAFSRGVKKPVVVVWDAFQHEESISDWDYPDVFVSKNSFVTFHLRQLLEMHNYMIEDRTLRVKEIHSEQDRKTDQILKELNQESRIRVYKADPDTPIEEIYQTLYPNKDLISVGRLGFPSVLARQGDYPVVFNTAYFLFEEEDYISSFSLLGDSYGLHIQGGQILAPPLFSRSAFLVKDDGEVETRVVSLAELSINVLGREWNLGEFSLNCLGDHALYTRFYGVKTSNRTFGYTPINDKNVDLVIIDQSIVGVRFGGGIEIPHNGFVLSVPAKEFEHPVRSGQSWKVTYGFSDGRKYRTGVQCGPGLVVDGEISLNDKSLEEEQFFRKRVLGAKVVDFGVVPTDYAPDIDETRAARTAIGLDNSGKLRVLAVEAVNKGMEESNGESSGVTLSELALLAKSRGYKHAINLDGGGSTNIQYLYGQLTRSADRRGFPGVMYERMVPSVGVVTSK